MKPTKRQLMLLRFYSKYQTQPLTMLGIVRTFWFLWLLLLVPLVAGYWLNGAGYAELGWMFVGMTIGAFLRDVNRILSLSRTWPVLQEIINWQRLGELIKGGESRSNKSPLPPPNYSA